MSHEPTEEEWHRLARQASKENDPDQRLNLAEQIVGQLKKVLKRIANQDEQSREF